MTVTIEPTTHVLAVDDETISREVLAKMLEHLGYSVDKAKDGKEALLLWQASKHATVITDCQMPNMNGFEFAAAVRLIEQESGMSKSTIIALTANDDDIEKKRCLDAGIDNMLSKPVNAEKLQQLLSVDNQANNHAKVNTKPPTEEQAIVDYAMLSEVFPDKNRQHMMLGTLEQHLKVSMIELQQHSANDDIEAVEVVAHRMKGACKMVGVNQVAATCNAIERAAREGALPSTENLTLLEQNILQFNALMHHEINTNNLHKGPE